MAMVPHNGGPQGFGPGGPGGPQMYGPPIKDKGPSLTTVMSDNMAVAVAKTFRTAHKVMTCRIWTAALLTKAFVCVVLSL